MTCLRLLPLLLIGLSACATHPLLTPGDYQETGGPDRVLFSSQQLRLYPDRTFEYFRHEDVVGGGKQGQGVYRVRGNQLELRFRRPDSRSSTAQRRSLALATPADAPTLTFLVTGSTGRGAPEVVPGATVLAYNKRGQVVAGATCDSDGRATLPLRHSHQPHRLGVTGVGFHAWEHAWPDQAAAYQVHLQAQVGSAYAARSKLHFSILQHTAQQLVVHRGRDTTTLNWRPLRGRNTP